MAHGAERNKTNGSEVNQWTIELSPWTNVSYRSRNFRLNVRNKMYLPRETKLFGLRFTSPVPYYWCKLATHIRLEQLHYSEDSRMSNWMDRHMGILPYARVVRVLGNLGHCRCGSRSHESLGFVILKFANYYIRFTPGDVPLDCCQVEQLFFEIRKYQAQWS